MGCLGGAFGDAERNSRHPYNAWTQWPSGPVPTQPAGLTEPDPVTVEPAAPFKPVVLVAPGAPVELVAPIAPLELVEDEGGGPVVPQAEAASPITTTMSNRWRLGGIGIIHILARSPVARTLLPVPGRRRVRNGDTLVSGPRWRIPSPAARPGSISCADGGSQ